MKKFSVHATLLVLFSGLLGACSQTQIESAEVNKPYLAGKAHQVDANRFLGPQPDARELTDLAAQGVSTVINFRRPEEMAELDFDQAQILADQSIRYVQIPVGPGLYSPAKLVQLRDALKNSEGKVVLHCRSGWRASELLVAHLVENEGWDMTDALQHAIGWWPLTLEQVTGKSYKLEAETP